LTTGDFVAPAQRYRRSVDLRDTGQGAGGPPTVGHHDGRRGTACNEGLHTGVEVDASRGHRPQLAPPSTSVTESAPVMAKLDEMVRTMVTQAIARAMPRTDSTNRSGRRRMFASANRTRHMNVLPDAEGGDRR